MKPDGTWLPPVNLGYPVNSTDDDIFFKPIGEGKIAYISKHDKKGYGGTIFSDLKSYSMIAFAHPVSSSSPGVLIQ